MLLTPHVLAGTAIGLAVGNPVAGFVLGVASHYVLDSVPHTDPGTRHYGKLNAQTLDTLDWAIVIADVATAIFSFYILSTYAPIAVAGPIAGAIGGFLPDSLNIRYASSKMMKWMGLDWYFDFINKFHYTAKPSQWVLGTATQLAVMIGSVWYILAR
jgi:hypothetical protein